MHRKVSVIFYMSLHLLLILQNSSFFYSRFALMEAKLLLFNVLANFKIVPSPNTPEKLTFKPDFNGRIKETVYLNFKRR